MVLAFRFKGGERKKEKRKKRKEDKKQKNKKVYEVKEGKGVGGAVQTGEVEEGAG